jgi:membrane-associated phospholipid phosphatase
MSIDWATLVPAGAGIAMLLVLAWIIRRDRHSPSTALVALALIGTCSILLGPAQYLAVDLRRPLIDTWLIAADARMGVSVPALTVWTAQHPWVRHGLVVAYASLLPQFVVPVLVLGFWRPDFDALGEYLFHFHVCAIVTVAALALWPAACGLIYTGPPSLLDHTRFIAHFSGLRAGTFHVIQFNNLEGLISCPSFHVAGAFMVRCATRRHRALFISLGVLNSALIASTVLLGAHYAVDVIATVVMWGGSLAMYRGWVAWQGRRHRSHMQPARVVA